MNKRKRIALQKHRHKRQKERDKKRAAKAAPTSGRAAAST
jgi:hypothetical protein